MVGAWAPPTPRRAFRVAAGELKDRRRRSGELREQASEFPDQLVDLFRALSRLSPTQRAAVVLHHYAGYRVREIAHILGSTPPAVRVHLSVGRKRLRSLLEDDDD
jgi:RNA polymerase sigma factor (sigma-70 family)